MGDRLGYHRVRPVGFHIITFLVSLLTPSSSEALGVKLGHRRVSLNPALSPVSTTFLATTADSIQILQKEIAHTRGVSLEQWTSSASRSRQSDVCRVGGQQDSTTDGKSNMGAGGKRKYRRHPKVHSRLLSS